MTVNQALTETIEVLKNINIPVGMIEQIGIPISGAIGNIQLCLDAFAQQEAEQQSHKKPVKDDINKKQLSENGES